MIKEKQNGLCKMKPLYDKVIVEEVAGEKKTAGGIIVPVNTQPEIIEFIVIACGEGKLMADGAIVPLKVKVGDKVIASKHNVGTNYNFEGVEYKILDEDSILAIIEGE